MVFGIPFSKLEKKCWDYSQKIMRRGTSILRKGYRKQVLSEKEIADFRLYAMWADITSSTWAATEGNNFLPFHLGLSRPFDTMFPKKRMNYSLQNTSYATRPSVVTSLLYPGDDAPDFTLIKPDTVYESERYTDNNPFNTERLLTPQVMTERLNALAAYDIVKDSQGRKTAVPKPVIQGDGFENNYVSLSSYRGKKPVLLFLPDPTDAWAWNSHIVEMVDCLHKAYKEEVEFIFVNTTAYDGYMPVYDFIGPVPGKMIAGHPVSMEERARITKMFYMGHPQVSIPSLLDDVGQTTRNSYMDQGGTGSFCLVDIDGKVAYRDFGDIVLIDDKHKADQYDFELHDRMRIRTNALEIKIRELLKNNGKLIPSRKSGAIKGKPGVSLFEARITGIDTDSGEIGNAVGILKVEVPCEEKDAQPDAASSNRVENFYVSTNHPPKPINKPYTIHITEQTRFACVENGEYRILSLDDLSIDQRININCTPDGSESHPHTDSSFTAGIIYDDNLRLFHYERYEKNSIWFSGHITSIDAKKNIVTAVMPKKVAQEMKGYHFWKKEEDRATLLDRTKETVPIVRKWVEGRVPDRTYRFKIDGGTDFFINGSHGSFADLKKGDSISVDYRTIQDGQELIYPDILRVSGKLKT